MSERMSGTAAASVAAHSKDAMQAAGAVPAPPRPDPAAWHEDDSGQGASGQGEGKDGEGSLRGTADRVLSAAQDAGESAARTARHLRRRAQVGSARAGRAASGAVQEYPMPALLLAGAAGLALGMLLARR